MLLNAPEILHDSALDAGSASRRGSISIRPLCAGDREPLREILAATQHFSPEEIDIALELIDACLTRPDQKDYIAYVATEDGVPAGYYCLGPTPGTEGTFDLYWIAVDPKRQGHGIGGALDAHATELVRSLGGRLIVAETSGQPRYAGTRKFYRRHGYAQVAVILDYYRPGDDCVMFGKSLV